MSALSQRAEEYLRLRHALGHELAEAVRLLPRLVAYLDSIGATTVTVDAALAWAQQPDAAPGSNLWARRMTVARGFARHMAGVDPHTQVPPVGLVVYRKRWRPPFIYTRTDIEVLMAEAIRAIRNPLRAATYHTVIGLLAATGMRVGEALRLQRCDIDWDEGVITVRASKFGKSRELPLADSTVQALARYAEKRDRSQPRPRASTFFVSTAGTAVLYPHFGEVFRRLVRATGVGNGSPTRARIHDLRHSFAVHTLIAWYQAGDDVNAMLPRLSTYLGHRDPVCTYWYLSAAPELLALAAARLQAAQEARS
jgi:integrase/recombinase XerD